MKHKYLTERERYQIESLLKAKTSVKDIACILGKCKATIYNEIKRGMVSLIDTDLIEKPQYCADVAQRKAEYNATNKGRDLKLGNDYEYVRCVTELIRDKKYSPYAVIQYLNQIEKKFTCSVCRGTLYNYIKMGLFEGVAMSSLPMPRKTRKNESIQRRKVSLNNTVCQSIEDRDKQILKRKEYGHWEMDTVVSGKGGKGVLLVFTERMTREEEIYKLPSKSSQSVVTCINEIENRLGFEDFKERYKTITCDNGVEFLDSVGIVTSHKTREKRTDLFFCHPYCSSERGSNENANKLIRRWIPKGSNISSFSEEYIKVIQDWINNYPRKIFGGLSSNQYKQLAI